MVRERQTTRSKTVKNVVVNRKMCNLGNIDHCPWLSDVGICYNPEEKIRNVLLWRKIYDNGIGDLSGDIFFYFWNVFVK